MWKGCDPTTIILDQYFCSHYVMSVILITLTSCFTFQIVHI